MLKDLCFFTTFNAFVKLFSQKVSLALEVSESIYFSAIITNPVLVFFFFFFGVGRERVALIWNLKVITFSCSLDVIWFPERLNILAAC